MLEGFRPGVAARLGVGPDDVPESVVYCSITGFGAEGPHAARAGHDLNYLGWAGVLEDTAPGLPPLQPADLAAGALGAVVQVLAARARARAHGPWRAADDLDGTRLPPARLAPAAGRPAPALPHGRPRLLPDLRDRGRPLAHGRRARAEVLHPALRGDRPSRARRRVTSTRKRRRSSARNWRRSSPARPLEDWLRLFDGEDVCVGPVATLAEGAEAFGGGTGLPSAPVGQHTSCMAGRARLLLIAAALAPLPLLAAVSASIDAEAARAAAARRLVARRRPLRRRPRDHDGGDGHRAGLVARPLAGSPSSARTAASARRASTSSAATAAACSA